MASIPPVQVDTTWFKINLTVVISVLTACLGIVKSIVALWGKSSKPEDLPGELNQHCQKELVRIKSIEKDTLEVSKKHDDLKEIVGEIRQDVAVLKNQSENTTKTLDEMKQSNREIANRLDDLLKQLMEWMSE